MSIFARAEKIRAGKPILSANLFSVSTQATVAALRRIITIPANIIRKRGRMVWRARKKEDINF
jgi:hypothetical protein